MQVLIYRTAGAVTGDVPRERLEVALDGHPTTVGEVLGRLVQRHGIPLGCQPREWTGRLRPGITVAVNRRDIEHLQGLDTPLAAEDEVAILGDLPAIVPRSPGGERRVVLRWYGPMATRWGLHPGARHELVVEGDQTLRSILAGFSAGFGVDLSDWLLDPESGDLRPLIRVAVNDRLLEGVEELDTSVGAGDQVMVMQFVTAASGG